MVSWKVLFIFTILEISILAAVNVIYTSMQTDDFDKTSLTDWQITNMPSYLAGSNPWTSDCGTQNGRRLFGGYMIFRGKTGKHYSIIKQMTLPPHFSFRFQAKLFKIDSWNPPDDVLYVQINGEQVFEGDWDCCFSGVDMCGSTIPPFSKDENYAYNDGIVMLDVNKTHTDLNWKVNFTSTHDDPENESWGFREVTISIDSCHYSCLTCSGPTQNQCLTCFAEASILADGRCKCNLASKYLSQQNNCVLSSCSLCADTCQAGYYQFIGDVNECKQCDSQCIGCVQSSSNCLNCVNSFYLKAISLTNNLCIQCPDGCNTCQMNNLNQLQCLTCLDGYYQNGYQCLPCDSKCQQCQVSNTNCTQCNTSQGYFWDGTQCQKCNSSCEQCNDLSGCTLCVKGLYLQATICIPQCPSPYFGNTIKRQCTLTCPDSYYPFWETRTCEKCHPYCAKCTKGDVNSCQDCVSPYFLNGRSCVDSCPATKFTDIINRQCNFFILAEHNKSCKIACQDGKQYDVNKFTCVACDPTCALCNGQLPINCTQCDPPRYLNSQNQCALDCPGQIKDQNTQTCVAVCAVQYFPKDGVCQPCNHSCQTCSSNSICDTCNANLKREYDPVTKLCKCQKGYYDDGISNGCFPCPANPDSLLTQCIQCPLNVNSVCVCPSGYFQDSVQTQVCIPCSAQCKTCSDKSVKCTSCNENQNRFYDPLSNSCNCIDGMYYNKAADVLNSLICQKCQITCKTCQDTFDKCIECRDEDNRVLNSGNCICNNGFYENNGLCSKCTYHCNYCQNVNSCLQCDLGYYLNINKICVSNCNGKVISLDGKSCVDSCPSDAFVNASINQCQTCDIQCSTCQKSSNQCTSCSQGYYQDQNQCVINCKDGMYNDSLNKLCKECPSKCSLCTSKDNCTKCKDKFEQLNGKCLDPCGTDQYRSIPDLQCKNCMEGCQKCNDFKICLKCDESIYQNQNGVCIQKCDFNNGGYLDPATKSCLKCHFSCIQCYDSSPNCLKCQENMVFNNKTGICECLSGYQWDEKGQICKQCINSKCPQCENRQFVLINCKCPDGQYVENILQCSQCVRNCKTCLSSPENTCLSCFGNQSIVEGDCIVVETDKIFIQLDDYHNFVFIFVALICGLLFIAFLVYWLKKKYAINQEQKQFKSPNKQTELHNETKINDTYLQTYQQLQSQSIIQDLRALTKQQQQQQ